MGHPFVIIETPTILLVDLKLVTAFTLISEVPLDGPALSNDLSKVAPGATIKANCTTPASFPKMNVTWFLNDVEVSYNAEKANYNNCIALCELSVAVVLLQQVKN